MKKVIFILAKYIWLLVFAFICYLEFSKLDKIHIEAIKQILNTIIFVAIGLFSGLSFFKAPESTLGADKQLNSRGEKVKNININKRLKVIAKLLLLTFISSIMSYLLMLAFQTPSVNTLDIKFIIVPQIFLFFALSELMILVDEI